MKKYTNEEILKMEEEALSNIQNLPHIKQRVASKVCNLCLVDKPLDLYYKSKTCKFGVTARCKKCFSKHRNENIQKYKQKDKKYYNKHRRRMLHDEEYRILHRKRSDLATKKWRLKNKERVKVVSKKYKELNKTKIKEQVRTWQKNNAGKCAANAMKRHTLKLKRTPKWLTELDLDEIKKIYIKASELTKSTGIKHEVDHIIPLQGELISGLHVPWNLQILTAKENRKKHNRISL